MKRHRRLFALTVLVAALAYPGGVSAQRGRSGGGGAQRGGGGGAPRGGGGGGMARPSMPRGGGGGMARPGGGGMARPSMPMNRPGMGQATRPPGNMNRPNFGSPARPSMPMNRPPSNTIARPAPGGFNRPTPGGNFGGNRPSNNLGNFAGNRPTPGGNFGGLGGTRPSNNPGGFAGNRPTPGGNFGGNRPSNNPGGNRPIPGGNFGGLGGTRPSNNLGNFAGNRPGLGGNYPGLGRNLTGPARNLTGVGGGGYQPNTFPGIGGNRPGYGGNPLGAVNRPYSGGNYGSRGGGNAWGGGGRWGLGNGAGGGTFINNTIVNNGYGGGYGRGYGGYSRGYSGYGQGYGYGPGYGGGYRGSRNWYQPYYGNWYRGNWGAGSFWSGFGVGALSSFGLSALSGYGYGNGYGYGGYGYGYPAYSGYGAYNYFPAWGASTYSHWGIGSVAGDWLYSGYTNPYYSASVAVQPAATVVYDYAQPLNLTAAPPEATVVDSSEQVFVAARDAFKAGDYPRAIELADQVLKQTPNVPVVHEFRALALFALRRYEEAAAVEYAVLSAGPGWNWETLVGLYPDVETYTNQFRTLESHARSNPNSTSAQFLLADHYLVQGHTDAARAEFERVVALQPNEALSASFVKALTKPAPPAPAAPLVAGPAPGVRPLDVPPVPPPPPADLAGRWTARPTADVSIVLTIKDGGAFVWEVDTKGQKQTLQGTAGFDEGILTLQQPDGPPLVGKVTRDGPDKFLFSPPAGPTDKPSGLTFTR